MALLSYRFWCEQMLGGVYTRAEDGLEWGGGEEGGRERACLGTVYEFNYTIV